MKTKITNFKTFCLALLLFLLIQNVSHAQVIGTDWQSVAQGQNFAYRSVVYGNGLYVAVASDGAGKGNLRRICRRNGQ